MKCRDISKAHKIMVMRYNKDGEPVNASLVKFVNKAIALTPIKIVEHT